MKHLHRPRRPALSGLSAVAIAAVAAAALACAGCGSSGTSTGSAGAQGSGTATSQPAAPASTQPAAPATAPAAPASGSVSLKEIVDGNGNACKAVSDSVVAAAIGPITKSDNPQGLDTCEWYSMSSIATFAAASRNYYPLALTSTYSNPVPSNVAANPCPSDASNVNTFGTSSSQYVTGAFCNEGGYEFQVVIGPLSNTANNGPAQIAGTAAMASVIVRANS